MSKFKVPFTLKQHTPIIHFQSEQSGATLRATELKPKFDRFLLQQIEDLPFLKNANGHRSLDYKIKIEQNISNPRDINSRESLFFGNMGDGEDKKYKLYTKTFTISFLSFNATIKEAVENNFEAFLANTNFGTRQSKGYGGFYIDKKEFNPELVPYKVYSFSTNNWEKDIKILYSFLRQGINLPKGNETRFYSKPAIFLYAKSKGWQWDKKSIKENYFNNILKRHQSAHQDDIVHFTSEEQYLLRDLFGLSSSQKWGKDYNNITIEKEDTNKDAKGKPVIDRFKSPLTFKIVDKKVYFWANDSIKLFTNKTFNIKARNQTNLNLSTPDFFDFNDFFDFTFKIDLSKHIESKYHTQSEYHILDKIFKDIKVFS